MSYDWTYDIRDKVEFRREDIENEFGSFAIGFACRDSLRYSPRTAYVTLEFGGFELRAMVDSHHADNRLVLVDPDDE
jgi:hypothetical protein